MIKQYYSTESGKLYNGDVLEVLKSMGSGTVAEVCEKYGRAWIGIELSQEYCDIAVKRIEKEAAQGKLALS